jgi:tagatose-1,6-bisphosphate aldolase
MLKGDIIVSLVNSGRTFRIAAADNTNDAKRQVAEMLNSFASDIILDTDETGYKFTTVNLKTYKVYLNG